MAIKKFHSGKHFLQLPGPSNVPDRILNAMSYPTIDHRGPEFAELAIECFNGIKTIFKTKKPVIIFPASGTGAWEAALVNTLNEGDHVLMVETGHFASLWNKMAIKLGLNTEIIETNWRNGLDHLQIEKRLKLDVNQKIKAVCIVHNETSTGCTSDVRAVRQVLDNLKHDALLMVDSISGLASMNYEHDNWGVDVTVSGSQKGLMLPPGLSFNAISDKALLASKNSKMRRSYWDWNEFLEFNKSGFFPYTPATNMLFGLKEAIAMLHEEGLENVFKRHARYSEATRIAIQSWGLEVFCANKDRFSDVLTAVIVPDNKDADQLRKVILENFNMSLGNGLSKLKGKVFRIGHLGDLSDLSLLGTLSGVEMGLDLMSIPFQRGGVEKAREYLKDNL